MALNLFGGKKSKEKINYLELTPYRKLEHEELENGLINVLVPRFKSELAKKILIPKNKSPHIKANLDEFGTETWKMIDGETKVKDIGTKLEEHFGEKIQPVYERLTLFLTQLYRNGFINFHEFNKGN